MQATKTKRRMRILLGDGPREVWAPRLGRGSE